MGSVAVSLRDVGKRYRLGGDGQRYLRLTESLASVASNAFRRRTTEDFWALRNISFDVDHGNVVGIIGRNGAGKSTLLKILSRITEPTEGTIVLHGRVGSLLEVGTGFHPELTGRENIFLSGSILGMRRADIRRQFDEIVAFAGVDRFLDTPVKRYSSGMQVRLGFAVAAHLEPEILVVDEVLAVGDLAFQKKCLDKMEDVAHGGRTVLFVSHNMAAVENLCESAILLEGGRVQAIGPTHDIVRRYVEGAISSPSTDLSTRTDRRGDGRMRVTEVHTELDASGRGCVRLDYRTAGGPIPELTVLIGVYTTRGEGALWLSTDIVGAELRDLPPEGSVVCWIEEGALTPGRYSLNVHCSIGGAVADYVIDAALVDVAEADYFGTGKLPPPDHGPVLLRHRWSVEAR